MSWTRVSGDRICAWCKKKMGETDWSSHDTHGICDECADKLQRKHDREAD